MSLTVVDRYKAFSGEVVYYRHPSEACRCDMTFAVYLPAIAAKQTVPVMYFLSGLTCNHENFMTKAGALSLANQYGVALVVPDTSPRDVGIAEADDSYDLGYGAGFYVNATQAPWAPYFNMYDYVVTELPALCKAHLPLDTDNASIMGHSMGGHGALMIALKNPDVYQSVSAFAPICAPTDCPWGQKALTAYLGDDQTAWVAYDTCKLIANATHKIPLLIDQGSADAFLEEQLNLPKLEAVCQQHDHPLEVRMRDGYDHGYYYIASFVEEHLCYHAKHLSLD